MLNKLKHEIKTIKWPNKKTIIKDAEIVLIGSVIMMLVMSGIDFLAMELLGVIM
jgi:preprotein translocase SecE subunit